MMKALLFPKKESNKIQVMGSIIKEEILLFCLKIIENIFLINQTKKNRKKEKLTIFISKEKVLLQMKMIIYHFKNSMNSIIQSKLISKIITIPNILTLCPQTIQQC